MWLSPLKGAHLTLGQLDKTLPVDISVDTNTKIQRGSFVYIKAADIVGETTTAIEPRFALYTATEAAKPNAVPYIALMGWNDFQAGMAGTRGQAPGVKTPGTSATGQNAEFLDVSTVQPKVSGPRITAISVLQAAEYQTSAFEPEGTDVSYYVGQPLTISNNGKLTPFKSAQNIVGYVTAKPYTRWVNDLGASDDGARISGGNTQVIEFSTAWIPVSSTVITEDDTTRKIDSGNGVKPGALNVGKPEVVKAESAGESKAKAK